MPVQVVTDSTADLPQALAAEHGITVVPLTVRFGSDEFRDGVDMGPSEFLRRLVAGPHQPSTAQPSPQVFREAYQEALDRGDDVVSVHISEKLSGTLNSARLARKELGESPRIAVLDSLWASMALGLVALEAARAAASGAGLDGVVSAARSAQSRARLLLFCDTLEYLHRGGRIGRAQAFLGGLLNVKPLITLKDGVVSGEERLRTRARAMDRLGEWGRGLGGIDEFCVLHVDSPGDAETLYGDMRARYPGAQHHITHVGPVVASHVGPGAVGLAALVAA